METYLAISKIEDLLIEAGELFDRLPASIQKAVLSYHSDQAAMQYCLRWGLQATKELRED